MIDLKSRRTLAAAAAALVVVGGGGAALAASGDSASPSGFWDSVAKHLGISTEKLQDATKAAALEQVDAALAAGTITSEQAEALRSRIEAGALPPFGAFGAFHGPHRGVLFDKLSTTADYLGLSRAELRERLAAGQSLADVARAEGKSVDGLKQAILDGVEKQLDEAVAAGKLTEAEAQAMRERLEERIDNLVNGTFPGPRGGLFLDPHVSGALPAAPFMALPA